MAKFSAGAKRPSPQSPITSSPSPSLRTYEGAPAFSRDTKAELFVLAASNFVGEKSFYEGADDRDERFRQLVAAVTASDPGWVARFVPYLRGPMNMRSAPLVMAAEYAIARKPKPGAAQLEAPTVRSVVASALQRPDEPAEFLAYWQLRTGRKSPHGGVQRGVADAVVRMFTQQAAIKYDGVGKAWRLGDVIELVHPQARSSWQNDLFRYLLDRRHHPQEVAVPESLSMILRNRAFHAIPKEERTIEVAAPAIRDAGITWEAFTSWFGPMTGKAWELVIPHMSYMALIRNLRNFDEAGVSKKVAQEVMKRLTDPDEVAPSRQLPMRFFSAFRELGTVRWSSALEDALQLSLGNVPSLSGRTLILVDRSGSMWSLLSKHSKLIQAEAAAIFGSALALRAEKADLVEFGTSFNVISFRKGDSLLSMVANKFHGLGGTNTAHALKATFKGHDRVVIVTDEQSSSTYGNPLDVIPASVPVFVWNLAGYRPAHGPYGSKNRHQFAGLSDAAFSIIPITEAASAGTWPF